MMQTILLFGVSNVGKTTIGSKLANKTGFSFYDLDEEVKKYYQVTLEQFVNTGDLRSRDKKRGIVLCEIMKQNVNKVVAVTPMSYADYFFNYLRRDDVIAIELLDTAENIFDRLVFSDENDVIYRDDNYKSKYRQHYLKEIKEDIAWYSAVYRNVQNKFYINNDQPEVAVDRLMKEYTLSYLRE
ncbi:MAG: hypothetical protein LUG99_00875 [Lachnospiraceae bacterium]|nr:hypothetical protein [Lachnospiraceae bacterium]